MKEKAFDIIEKNLKRFDFDDFFVQNFAKNIFKLIEIALDEDLDVNGDITSNAIFDSGQQGRAKIIAKQKGILCGNFLVELIANHIDEKLIVKKYFSDGDQVLERQRIIDIHGSVRSILKAERTILNFISRASGIATLANEFVKKTQNRSITILDTRKTLPGWRYLDKYAVKVGGAKNHRIGLFDMFLIKENHINAAGSIDLAVKRCREYAAKINKKIAIEIEVGNMDEVKQALMANVDRIMLDNMDAEQIEMAARLIREHDKKIEIEISGGVNLANLENFLQYDIDFISIGELTHSARAFDFSLLIE